jgi:anti-sigma-K factor RskA
MNDATYEAADGGRIAGLYVGNSKATVAYGSDMSVTVTPQGGQPTNYPSCLVEELQMCVPA